MRRLPVKATLHLELITALADAARAAGPTETGGLLLGWWSDEGIVVRHAIEVIDPDATASSWTRDQGRAQHALEQALTALDHPLLGYIGDWHTHPASCGPSHQDERSIRRASRGYDQPLLLLVHRADERLEARAAQRGQACTVTLQQLLDEVRNTT